MTPRTRVVITLGVGIPAVALLAFGAGRASAPARVEHVERVVYKDRVVAQVVREQAQVQTRVVYRDRIVTPDGTVREREVERLASVSAEREQAERVEVHDGERLSTRTVTAPAPDWRVSALVGVPLQLRPGPVLAGVHIQRRLIGPVSAGAWTLIPTGPGAPVTVGVSVSVEF